jgi:D-sedoheptulose 7-phosphate isomerase
MTVPVEAYFREMHRLAVATQATDGKGERLGLDEAIAWMTDATRATHARGNKLMVIGNGGSAAIASHLATDYTKNGGIRTQAFNDGSMLTCLGNDLGYENVFAKQVAMFAQRQDLLIAISSSGKSPNILAAVEAARATGCAVATFSGFDPNNPLRGTGDVNFYVASHQYGFVEILHLALCHAVLDILMGWKPADERASLAIAAAGA